MSGGNTLLAPAAMIVGSSPDQRRAISAVDAPAAPLAGVEGTNVQSAKPPVTIAVSAISINVGDKIIGTIIGPDSNGQRHFVAAQGIFSVDPQSALEGLSGATLTVTRSSRGIEAVLMPDTLQTQPQMVPVKLQLVQANIAQLTEVLNTEALIASDMPITLATEIGQALRVSGVVLPKGFAVTPKSLPTQQFATIAPATQTLPTAIEVSTPAVDAIISTTLKPEVSAVGVGSSLKIERLATTDAIVLQSSMSVLTDMPDSKMNRAMLLQSPLFANLLRNGRLTVVATPTNTFAQPQILTPSDVAQLTRHDPPTTAVALLDTNDAPLNLPSGRLLLLVDTAPSNAPPLATRQSIETLVPLAAADTETLYILQKLIADGDAILQHRPGVLPTLKADLPADILLLFNAFGRKLAAPALHKIAQGRYTDDAAPASPQAVIETVAQLISRSAAPAPIAESQQRLVLPLQVDGQLIPLVFVFSPPQDRPFEDAWRHDDAVWTEKEQIFGLSIEFDQLGPLTLRGRCDTRSLNLEVETRAPLPEMLETSSTALFLQTLDAAGMVGSIHFSLTSDRGWQTASPAL
jgi:hypothetical protein